MHGFTEPNLLVLLSLIDSPKHGYGILTDIQNTFHITIGPGTLYGAIKNLCDRQLIEPLPVTKRRKPYRITPAGHMLAVEHIALWSTVASVGTRRLKLA